MSSPTPPGTINICTASLLSSRVSTLITNTDNAMFTCGVVPASVRVLVPMVVSG